MIEQSQKGGCEAEARHPPFYFAVVHALLAEPVLLALGIGRDDLNESVPAVRSIIRR